MPRAWLYFLALWLPLAVSVLVLDTRFFLEWLWYKGYGDYYNLLNALSVQPQLVECLKGWPFPIFVMTVFAYWMTEYHEPEAIAHQFLLLPIAYIPFLIVGRALETWQFTPEMYQMYPFVVLLGGYAYVLAWVAFIWILDRLRLVV